MQVRRIGAVIAALALGVALPVAPAVANKGGHPNHGVGHGKGKGNHHPHNHGRGKG
jgi:hypothetical protein